LVRPGAAESRCVPPVEQAALDPFRGYANAIHDGLPDAVAVLEAFHVVRLGTQIVDESAAASSKTLRDRVSRYSVFTSYSV
jgi:transposase